MTGEELKQSILQMAIQGKLVPQDPENDEPAWKLLERIKEEKDQLIKEKKIKKEKSLPPISDDEKPFEIPVNWEWVRHNEILEISGGAQPSKNYFSTEPKDGYIRLYQIRDYGNNPHPIYIPKEIAKKTSKKGEILLARYGGSLGKIFIAQEGAYNVAMAKVINLFKAEVINKGYLYVYYQGELYQNLVKNNNRSAQGGFNKEDLNNLLIPLPPLEEQKRIVAKLEELQPLIDRYTYLEQKLSKLNKEFPQKLKESILQEAIQGKLTEQDYENDEPAWKLLERIKEEKEKLTKEKLIKKERPLAPVVEEEKPFDIPTNWEWVRLGEITTYGQPKKKASLELKESSIWSLDLEEIEKNTGKILAFKSANEKKIRSEKTVFSANDVLYSKLRPYLLKILVAPRDGICTSEIIPFSGYSGISSEYIVYFLRSPTTDKNVNSQTYGIKMPRVGTSFMYSLPFPLPPLEEQKRIVAKLEDLQLLTDELNQKLTNHF